jgi:hypothetical protein
LPWRQVEPGREKQRYYTHFGKQAREVLGWFLDPTVTAERKSSPMVQMVREQFFGTQGQGFDVPWVNKNFYEGFFGREGRIVGIGAKFVPFSWRGNNFAFSAPMAKGATPWKGRTAIVKELRAFSDPTLLQKAARDDPTWEPKLESLVVDTLEALERNGHPSKRIFNQSLGIVRGEQYRAFFQALQDGDQKDMEKTAEAIVRLHSWLPQLLESARNRNIDLDSEELAEVIEVFRSARSRVMTERAKETGQYQQRTAAPPLSAESRRDKYDYEAARQAGLRPDETGHWPSRVPHGPNEGLILKLPGHPTLDQTRQAEETAGYRLVKRDGRMWSEKK